MAASTLAEVLLITQFLRCNFHGDVGLDKLPLASGTKLFVKYKIGGTWVADVMQGSLKALSIERPFVGRRRRSGFALNASHGS